MAKWTEVTVTAYAVSNGDTVKVEHSNGVTLSGTVCMSGTGGFYAGRDLGSSYYVGYGKVIKLYVKRPKVKKVPLPTDRPFVADVRYIPLDSCDVRTVRTVVQWVNDNGACVWMCVDPIEFDHSAVQDEITYIRDVDLSDPKGDTK